MLSSVPTAVVLDERSEHEPEEPDPGAEAEAVTFDARSGEDLVADLPDAGDVPAEVRRTFWLLVLLVKVGVLATVLGLLLAYFWGWTTRGGALVVVGLFAFADVVVRIRRFDPEQ